ncbi:type II secretion system minor pseudopilin GspK [Pseudomonas sp. S 311-6]|uniref:type II secretion system minor pseudopilin GspK n=1 Tax=Kerstersia gyiorum TaxID=206506 RepID=UPI0020972040|nr:type II secretion system minor pseudopilin GspK [Pseudomonas sp. S 311-6]
MMRRRSYPVRPARPAPGRSLLPRLPSMRLTAWRQRGMAVISALIVVAAAAIAATAILERQAYLARTLASERDRAQADWLLRGGLDWSRVILRWDARRNAITRPDSAWARPITGLEISEPDDPRTALFSGRAEDEQSKYNLNNLAAQGIIKPDELMSLERLLNYLRVPTHLASSIAQRVADSQPTENRRASAPGLRTINDLRGIDDIDATTVDLLRPYLTVLPATTAINANTASAEVLSAAISGLSLADARALVVQRDRGQWFNNSGDFVNRLPNRELDVGNRITANSNWFRVAGEVSLDNAVVGMEALLNRADRNSPTVVWIKEMN